MACLPHGLLKQYEYRIERDQSESFILSAWKIVRAEVGYQARRIRGCLALLRSEVLKIGGIAKKVLSPIDLYQVSSDLVATFANPIREARRHSGLDPKQLDQATS